MSKHIWDITLQDLTEHAVWQFPMWKDDSCDETIVIPATEHDALSPNSQLIVKARFIDAIGFEFVGYIKYGLTEVEYSQPCMFIKSEAINFWFGFSKPNEADLTKLNFPIVATSVPIYCLVAQSVTIEGYGYINENSSSAVMYC
jgi:hypothetical protein